MKVEDFFKTVISGPFREIPNLIPMERYDQAIKLLVNEWASLPVRPLAIYQIGSVAAPGISDLDFIIVFPSGVTVDWQRFLPEAFPCWVREMFTHPPYLCTEEVWPELPAWYPVFNLKHLYGQKYDIPAISNNLLPGCALGMLVDYFMVKIPRDFLWIAWEQPVRLRVLLAMLHSFKYTMRLAIDAGLNISSIDSQIISHIDGLRTTWFLERDDRFSVLARLCYRVCFAAFRLIDEVDRVINNELKNACHKKPCTKKYYAPFTFSSSWSYEEAIRKSFEIYLKSGEILWANPESFMQILAVYSDETECFEQYFKRLGIKTELRWDGGIWNKGLRHHANAMIHYSKAAEKLGVPSQKYVALGYFTPPSFLKSMSNYIARKFHHY